MPVPFGPPEKTAGSGFDVMDGIRHHVGFWAKTKKSSRVETAQYVVSPAVRFSGVPFEGTRYAPPSTTTTPHDKLRTACVVR